MQKSNTLIALFAGTIMLHNGCALDPDPAKGDRPDDGCPDGEICSNVVKRLYFSGTTLGDQIFSVKPRPFAIAKGGTQNIAVWLDGNASQPFETLPQQLDGPSGPFCGDPNNPLAFCALDGGLNVLSIQSPMPPIVKVVGLRAGLDHLRILANFGAHTMPTELYDRIILPVADLADMRVATQPDLDFSAVHGYVVNDRPLAFAVTSHPPVVVIGMFGLIEGGNRVRVVDELLSLTNVPKNLSRDPNKWDTMIVNTPFGQTQDHLINATSGSGNPLGQVRLRVVGSVDQIVRSEGPANQVKMNGRLEVGVSKQVCFSSFTSSSALIYGAKLTFQGNTNVEVTPVAQGGPHVKSSCTNVRPLSAGLIFIRVTSDANPNSVGGELSQTFSFDACESGGCAVAPAEEQRVRLRDSPDHLPPGPAPGQRALAR